MSWLRFGGILFRHQSWAELFPQLVMTAVFGGVFGYIFLASTAPTDSGNSKKPHPRHWEAVRMLADSKNLLRWDN